MFQDNGIIFSLKKFKRVFIKHWYIVLVTFLLGIGCVSISTVKSMSKSSGQTITESSATASDITKELVPSGTTYFNIVRYVKIDWSEKFPDLSVSDSKSAEENYYTTYSINSQTSYKKQILTDCKNIINFDSFKNNVSNILTNNNFNELTNTDLIYCEVINDSLIQFSIYSQCSVDRIISLLDAVVDTYSKIGQEVFNLGNCTAIETNNVYAHTKGKDGKFTALNMTASEWLESEIKKGSQAAEFVSSKAFLMKAFMTNTNIIIISISILIGFGILLYIAIFDQIIDIPEEIAFLGLDSIGTYYINKPDLSNVISVRIATLAQSNNFNSISVISMNNAEVLSDVCTNINCDNLSIKIYQYPDTYLSNISNVNQSDSVIIALSSGIDKKSRIRQLLENLKVDNPNIYGYIWIE